MPISFWYWTGIFQEIRAQGQLALQARPAGAQETVSQVAADPEAYHESQGVGDRRRAIRLWLQTKAYLETVGGEEADEG